MSASRPFSPARTRVIAEALAVEGVKLLIHQPSYSMFNRWIETDGLIDTLGDLGVGCIGFSPLAQGLLTEKYIDAQPADGARATKGGSFGSALLTPENLANVRALAAIARRRGQTLAQMAIAWTLRDKRVTSSLVGARTVNQLDDSLDALRNASFGPEELAEIDAYAVEGGVDLWRPVSRYQ